MLTFFLFIALTNLVIGIVLGYFYGPVFLPPREAEQAASPAPIAESAANATPAKVAGDSATAVVAPTTVPAADPKAASANATPAEATRPIKPSGSRAVSALDLADVMGELGVAPASPTVEPALATAAEPPAAAAAPNAGAAPITFEALTGEAAPVAG